ncbi:hypothetical protein AVEN_120889-1 [Araneus ventricosus]|uniref:Mos1 transposase HTH domain-containing protein n=1 Tax=Araneus ventricosus TaxID=182803 RepID=A0A4Y2JG66_ARAVE|nr:hypothetical protein AVEN_120889-1 [Araneus ventricosus]
MTEIRVLKTWFQMEARAVMRYECVRGTSILDIRRRFQSVCGDNVMSHQMIGRSCSMFSERSQMWQTWMWRGAQIGLCLPTPIPPRTFIAHDSTHFHLRPGFEHTSLCHTVLH